MFRHLTAIALASMLAACGSTADSGETARASRDVLGLPSAGAPSVAPASATPVASASSAPSSVPSAAAAECATSASGTLMNEQALLVDVRVGTHDGYDRVVFEFGSRGAPTPDRATYDIARATAPFLADPSGMPITIAGDRVLGITFHGATSETLAGTSAYAGTVDFRTQFPTLAQLKRSGDFEAVSGWFAGLTGRACLKTQVLSSPTRLVVDLVRR